MKNARSRISGAGLLALGLSLGWGLASSRPTLIHASSGDRSGESVLTTGPIMVRYDEGNKVQIPQDALYILDYKSGRLFGTIPSLRKTVRTTSYMGTTAERDLAADFKLDLDNGPKPHFLMTTGSMGTYNGGWAPLFVYETGTNQVAIYRIHEQTVGTRSSTTLELLELRTLTQSKEQPAHK